MKKTDKPSRPTKYQGLLLGNYMHIDEYWFKELFAKKYREIDNPIIQYKLVVVGENREWSINCKTHLY